MRGLHRWARLQAEEKEANIDRMRERILRRMMNGALATSWSNLWDHWQGRLFVRQCRETAAAHMYRYTASVAFKTWQATWSEIRSAKLAQVHRDAASGRTPRCTPRIRVPLRCFGCPPFSPHPVCALCYNQAEAEIRSHVAMQDEVVRLRAELASATSERLELRERVATLDGSYTEMSKLVEERESAEKGERVELLHKQALRRLQNLALIGGFNAWQAIWLDKRENLKLLRDAANRLRRPALYAAIEEWRADWLEAKRQAERGAWHMEKDELIASVAKAEAEIANLREAHAKELERAASDKEMALRKQLVELTGTAEERVALKEEEGRLQRVQEMQQRMTRRLLNAGLVDAFSAWVDVWEARTFALARLRKAGNYLTAPETADAFRVWVSSYDDSRAHTLPALATLARARTPARTVPSCICLCSTPLSPWHMRAAIQV